MPQDLTETQVARLPACDICKVEFSSSEPNLAAYDGKTTSGPWAYMCEDHFDGHGVGLGTGRGQRLVLDES